MEASTIEKPIKSFSLFPDELEFQFFQAFRPLKELGCDYLYFLGIYQGIKYRFCTHFDWIHLYSEESFFLNDPLKRVAEYSKFIILPWEQVTHLHEKEKRTMCGRTSFGLFNGLSLSREFNKQNYVFAFATESKEHDLARYLLLSKYYSNELIMMQFIQVISSINQCVTDLLSLRVISKFNFNSIWIKDREGVPM